MKKNSEYVGVDEKFIPEEEKYVDDSILGDKEEAKEKVKNYVEKSRKNAKKIIIGYLCFAAIIGIMIFASMFSVFSKVSKMQDKILNSTEMFDNV